LFQDDFESQPSANVSVIASPDAATVAVPTAPSVGTWVASFDPNGGGGADANVQVTNYATPGAASGSNYLRLYRTAGQPFANATFAPQTRAGDHLRLEADIRVSSAAPTVGVEIIGGTGHVFGTGYTTLCDIYSLASTVTDGTTSIAYTPDVYQKYQLDYVIGASTLTLQIGANSATFAANAGNVGFFGFGSYPPNVAGFAIDNVTVTNLSQVPEPSAITLLASALFGLLAYAWRKQK
jgi:hypothetical protein